jgi:hypothetical protein
MNHNKTEQQKAKADYVEARSAYDEAWRDYVDAPGAREQARAALGEARSAMDKAWFTYNWKPLPKDLVNAGARLTQFYRSHSKGGRGVYLQNSLPGRADGHRYLVFQIDIVNGKEPLGATLGDCSTLSSAIDIAARAP